MGKILCSDPKKYKISRKIDSSEKERRRRNMSRKPENGEKKIFTMSKARKGIIRVKNNVCLSHKQIEARCILSQKYEINAIIAHSNSTIQKIENPIQMD